MISLRRGDITGFDGDIIVNAANANLAGGAGVDGAIHAAAGPDLAAECQKHFASHGPLSEGEVIITKSGKLPCRFVIHAVGPQWKGGTNMEDEKLANCYINALKYCEISDCHSIAFPNISTGVYGFPKKDAAEVAVEAVRNYLSSAPGDLQVYFYCFDEQNFRIYQELLGEAGVNLPPSDPTA